MKLIAKVAEKPWGQAGVVPLGSHSDRDRRVGEVSFEHPAGVGMPVLIKYLYTSERLSIQVHPDDDQARSAGHPCGKDEMWIVLDAAADASIGLGLKRKASREEVESAIADGSIVELVDWRPVAVGDVIYNRAGTIHAAGAGLVLLEVQQSVDLTYRLFDYGRPRELHIDQGLAVSRFEPHCDARDCHLEEGDSRVLTSGPHFGAAWCSGHLPSGLPVDPDHWQVVAVSEAIWLDGVEVAPGEAAYTKSLVGLEIPGGSVALVTWPVQEALAQAA